MKTKILYQLWKSRENRSGYGIAQLVRQEYTSDYYEVINILLITGAEVEPTDRIIQDFKLPRGFKPLHYIKFFGYIYAIGKID